jgi:hypothetical protein
MHAGMSSVWYEYLNVKINNDEIILERFSDDISTAEATHNVERTRRLNLPIYIPNWLII